MIFKSTTPRGPAAFFPAGRPWHRLFHGSFIEHHNETLESVRDIVNPKTDISVVVVQRRES